MSLDTCCCIKRQNLTPAHVQLGRRWAVIDCQRAIFGRHSYVWSSVLVRPVGKTSFMASLSVEKRSVCSH